MLGIPTYKPQFHTTALSFRNEFEGVLRGLIGKRIERFWLMWDNQEDEWLTDGPVVLEIDKQQFEFTAYQLNKFSMTINSFELSEKLDWYGMGDEVPLRWKENAKPEMLSNLNKPILGVNLLMHKFANNGCTIVDSNTLGMLIGIEFIFEKSSEQDTEHFFSISNGLDQNELRKIEAQEEEEVIQMRI